MIKILVFQSYMMISTIVIFILVWIIHLVFLPTFCVYFVFFWQNKRIEHSIKKEKYGLSKMIKKSRHSILILIFILWYWSQTNIFGLSISVPMILINAKNHMIFYLTSRLFSLSGFFACCFFSWKKDFHGLKSNTLSLSFVYKIVDRSEFLVY